MDESEIIKERFKSAVSSAARAISENFNLDVKFGKDKNTTKDSLNLPEVESIKNFTLSDNFPNGKFLRHGEELVW